MATFSRRRRQGLDVVALAAAKRLEIESARRNAVALPEVAREVGRRREATRQRYLGQRPLAIVSHQEQRAFQPQPFHELVERLSDQRSEDPMEVKRRETRDTRDVFKAQRLVEVVNDVVDCAIDSLDVVDRRLCRSSVVDSQDLSSSEARAVRCCHA